MWHLPDFFSICCFGVPYLQVISLWTTSGTTGEERTAFQILSGQLPPFLSTAALVERLWQPYFETWWFKWPCMHGHKLTLKLNWQYHTWLSHPHYPSSHVSLKTIPSRLHMPQPSIFSTYCPNFNILYSPFTVGDKDRYIMIWYLPGILSEHWRVHISDWLEAGGNDVTHWTIVWNLVQVMENWLKMNENGSWRLNSEFFHQHEHFQFYQRSLKCLQR